MVLINTVYSIPRFQKYKKEAYIKDIEGKLTVNARIGRSGADIG